MIPNSPLKIQIEKALTLEGFQLNALSLSSSTDLKSVLDSDVLVLDRQTLESLMKTPSEQTITVGPLTLYPASFEAICNNRRVDLTTSEFQLLQILCENRPHVLSRKRLVEIFTEMGVDLSFRTIDNHIFNLRKKLGDRQDIIGTIRGVGYKVRAI